MNLDLERFNAKWTPEPFSGCWLWTAYCTPSGYGSFTLKNWPYRAHRASWILKYGTIPDGLLVLHKCDTPSCVNPDHLFIGTQSDNLKDAFRKGRISTKGDNSRSRKLCTRDVAAILAATGSQKEIASRYNVHHSTISLIKSRKIWLST